MVLGDPRFSELRVEDFEKLSQELVTKVRCYGYAFPQPFYHFIIANKSRFGAVLEEFEVRDALESVFYTKPDFNGHL